METLKNNAVVAQQGRVLGLYRLSFLQARKFHLRGYIVRREDTDHPLRTLLETVSGVPNLYQDRELKMCRVEQYYNGQWPDHQRLMFGILAQSSFVGGVGETDLLGVTMPKGQDKNRLLGHYYGYPPCCIEEYLTQLNEKSQKVPPEKRALYRKALRLDPHKKVPVGGFYPCWDCLASLEAGGDRLTGWIEDHRLAPDPFPAAGDEGRVMAQVALHWLTGTLER